MPPPPDMQRRRKRRGMAPIAQYRKIEELGCVTRRAAAAPLAIFLATEHPVLSPWHFPPIPPPNPPTLPVPKH